MKRNQSLDAKRYRFLVKHGLECFETYDQPSDWDAAVDRAMEEMELKKAHESGFVGPKLHRDAFTWGTPLAKLLEWAQFHAAVARGEIRLPSRGC